MANTVSTLTAVLQMNNTKFKAGLTGSQKALNTFNKHVTAIGGAMAATFSVRAIVNYGKEAIKLSSQMEGVQRAFNNLGQPGLLDDLQKATRGTVDNLQLMQAAVKAKNFKIPLENLATYFDFATSRAIQTGESVDYLVDSIINGIGRKSSLVLDNLGISATELQEEIKKVGDFGQAAANIIARELKNAGDVADTTAIQINRITTALTNLKIAAGERMTGGFLGRGVAAAAERWTGIFGNAEKEYATDQFMKFYGSLEGQTTDEKVKAIEDRIKSIQSNIELYAKRYQAAEDLMDNSRGKKKKEYKDEMDYIYDIQTKNVALLNVYREQLGALKQINEQLDTAASSERLPPSGPRPDFIHPGVVNPQSLFPSQPNEEILPQDMYGARVQGWIDAGNAVDEFNDYLVDASDELEDILEDEETLEHINVWSEQQKDIEGMLKDMERLETAIKYQLVKAFTELGGAIVQTMKGAEDAIINLGITLAENIGNILMMAGLESGKWWMVAVGAAIELGTGIYDAFQEEDTYIPAPNTGSHTVEFALSGNNLAATMNSNTLFRQIAT